MTDGQMGPVHAAPGPTGGGTRRSLPGGGAPGARARPPSGTSDVGSVDRASWLRLATLLNGSAPLEPIADVGHDDLELLSFRAVAKLLHCQGDRVADLVATGAIKSVPVGRGLRRVPRWALREYQLSLVGAR